MRFDIVGACLKQDKNYEVLIEKFIFFNIDWIFYGGYFLLFVNKFVIE